MKKYILSIIALFFAPACIAFAYISFPPNQGGTGTNCTPVYGQVLVGTSGGIYNCQATSTLRITGGNGTGTISTSSTPTIGNIPYWTDNSFPSLLGSVATGTLSATGPITVTAGQSIIGSGATIACPTCNTATLPLSVSNGGTGQASFGQGWLSSNGSTITSSTSPTVNYITATSTTATSTILGKLSSVGTTTIASGLGSQLIIGSTSPLENYTDGSRGYPYNPGLVEIVPNASFNDVIGNNRPLLEIGSNIGCGASQTMPCGNITITPDGGVTTNGYLTVANLTRNGGVGIGSWTNMLQTMQDIGNDVSLSLLLYNQFVPSLADQSEFSSTTAPSGGLDLDFYGPPTAGTYSNGNSSTGYVPRTFQVNSYGNTFIWNPYGSYNTIPQLNLIDASTTSATSTFSFYSRNGALNIGSFSTTTKVFNKSLSIVAQPTGLDNVGIGTTTPSANASLTIASGSSATTTAILIGTPNLSGGRTVYVDATAGHTTCTEVFTVAGSIKSDAITCPAQ